MKKLFIPFCFLLFVSIATNAQTFHAILVYQDGAPGVAKDKVLIANELDEISINTNMDLVKYEYSKDDPTIIQTIRNISPSSDDVVLFYYTGHGSNSGDGWPMLSGEAGSMKQTDIHNKLSSKGARLVCTMFDCCNGGPTDGRAPSIIGRRQPLTTTHNLMWKNSSGEVKASSSKDGNYSWGTEETGGFFTSSFINSTHGFEVNNPGDQNRVWSTVLKNTHDMANNLCNQISEAPQEPKYEINLNTEQLDTYNAPDVIELGKGNIPLFRSFEEIYNHYKNHPEHQGLTVAKLKKWNPGVRSFNRGQAINLVNRSNVVKF